MLNELNDLAKVLKDVGMYTVSWHRKFMPLPKPPSKAFLEKRNKSHSIDQWAYYNVLLGQESDGRICVCDFSKATIEEIAEVRRYGNNQKSFPVFKMFPLYIVDKATIESLCGFLSQVRSDSGEILARIFDGIRNGKRFIPRKVRSSLALGDTILKMLGEIPSEFSSIGVLCERTASLTAEDLHDQLADLLCQYIAGNPSSPEIPQLFRLLMGTKASGDQAVLSLHDAKAFKYPPNHRKVQSWMNEQFLKDKDSGASDSGIVRDAYGEDTIGLDDIMPQVKLARLGNVKLRAMFKDVPCQYRYEMIGSGSFPIGTKSRQSLKDALEWLSASERKGKTWCDITNLCELGKAKMGVILLAYPSHIRESLPGLAELFGGAADASESEAYFQERSARVVQALKGQSRDGDYNDICIFVLAKHDKSRTKVVVSRRYSVERLVAAARGWEDACRLPASIRIKQFGDKKGEKPYWAEPLVPSPAEIVWCLNTVWVKGGLEVERAHGSSIGDVLSLMLDEGAMVVHLAQRALRTLVLNFTPLVIAISETHNKGHVFVLPRSYAKQARLAPSLLSLLLHKSTYSKGENMSENPAHLVGRLLSLVDQLHMQYCEHVRKGSIPQQLIGNALMPTALEQPIKALSLLANRIRPYQAWAQTAQGEGVGLAKWLLGETGKICENLRKQQIPEHCSDGDKAMMLLGYLARSGKAEQGDNQSAESAMEDKTN